jgi:uncharacterized protein
MVRDPKQASTWFHRAAEQGCVEAQINLGNAYLKWNSAEERGTLYRRLGAAEPGDGAAIPYLGVSYLLGVGVERDSVPVQAAASRWFCRVAKRGDADAQYNLCVAYFKGDGVKKEQLQAVAWYRRAAEQGFAAAQSYLGCAYLKGDGVEQDPVQAVTWFRRAAEQGDAAAQTYLGIAYFKGDGVEEDPVQAAAWFRRAAEQSTVFAVAFAKVLV